QLKNELGGIGMHEQANASYDNFDRPLLPAFINHPDIYFSHPEHFSKAFSRDIVEIKENHIWEFVASTNHENKNVTLSWNADDIKKLTNQLMLYDILHDQIIDMSNEDEYSFTIDSPSTFKVIYGDEAFIKDALGKIKTEALRPYPNPFNDIVTIPINLPYSNNDYNIECSIYNLMGEKVFERKLENIDHGLYQLDWDEDQNRKLNQGIYIYSIKIKNGFLTNNFHGRIVKN
ncbi:MAG: gliding motility-associated C-terminal domain-containing protein, partial [Cyclobacteriaceae bacterium]|nr:gliding motility-associated C-terminal domain-containing protein [Cyclobacteriaceae bacterium]